ncbi:damaged DNA-binding protein [Lithospermum erythrorhizon]|uniref:Damaged DNA-binding protein n=1 Tax=Lithospermum erythrorhizon TaxID=34254 RepID=A0AAV3RX66_LITER
MRFVADVAVKKELHTLASDRSCTHLECDIFGTGLTFYGSSRLGGFQKILDKGKGILLTTYDTVINNLYLCGDDECTIKFDYMFADVGHLVKNPETQRAQSLCSIPCPHRIIITGTPIQNNLQEFWALFDLCIPGLLHDKNVVSRSHRNTHPCWT